MSGAVETEAIPKPEALDRKCDICGAEIRLGSEFCYNCGSKIREAEAKDDASEPSGDVDPTVKQDESSDTPEVEKPAQKTARVRRHRPVKFKETTYRWEEPEGIGIGSIAITAIIVALVIFLIAAGFYFR